MDGKSDQGMGDAFAHRPADQGHVRLNALGVALSDHPAVLHHHNGTGSFGCKWFVLLKGAIEYIVQPLAIDLRWLCRSHVDQAPGTSAWLGISVTWAGLAEQPWRWLPVHPPGAAPFSVLNGFRAEQSEQGAGFNAPSPGLDPGLDQPLAGGQIFPEHPIRIHSSHEHTAAELFGAEARARPGEVGQVLQRRFQGCPGAEGHCCS